MWFKLDNKKICKCSIKFNASSRYSTSTSYSFTRCTLSKNKDTFELQYLFDDAILLCFNKVKLFNVDRTYSFVELLTIIDGEYIPKHTIDYDFPDKIDHEEFTRLKETMSIF